MYKYRYQVDLNEKDSFLAANFSSFAEALNEINKLVNHEKSSPIKVVIEEYQVPRSRTFTRG